LSGVKEVVESVGPATKAVLEIFEDPYLPEAACELDRLARIQDGKHPGVRCAPTSLQKAAAGGGVGLKYVVPVLRGVVYHYEKPWLFPAIAGGVLGAIYLMGFRAGERRSR